MLFRCLQRGGFIVATSVAFCTAVYAQELIKGTEELDFNRPESWAQKYFSSVSLFTGFGVPREYALGAIELGFEGGWVPSLSKEQQRVGFNGTKLEALNRTSFIGRLRVTMGLPDKLSLTFGWVPPVRLNGVTPRLFALAIGRPFDVAGNWSLGARGYFQLGMLKGDITCDADTVAARGDASLNPYRCESISKDQQTQRLIGSEVTLSYDSGGKWEPYVGLAMNYHNMEFQVDAQYAGLLDRTLQLTEGVTWSVTGGGGYEITPRLRITGEFFYSGLGVLRPPETKTQNDGLFNIRFLLVYQLR